MAITAEIAFDLAANGIGDYLTLDDPVKGVLDGTTYKLSGDVLVDVTDRMRSFSIKRGRSRQLERFTAGAANLTLDNRDRIFDPTNVATVGTRTNAIINPSFGTNASNWFPGQLSALARITTDGKYGASCGLATADGGVDPGIIAAAVTVTPGQIWTGSCYIKDVDTGLTTAYVNIHWYAGATFIGQESGSTTLSTSQWSRASATGTVPATADTAYLIAFGFGTPAAGKQLLFDAALLERGDVLLPYFDGTNADGSIRVITEQWNATPDASTSTITYSVPGTGSPYSGSIVPRKRVVIAYDGTPLSTTMVEDWNFSYTLDGDSTAEVSCADGFTVLNGQTVTPGTATAQATGARVTAVLDDVDWPDSLRAVSTGSNTLYADVIGENTNALAYLQKVETSEAGALFVSAAGALTFRSRTDMESFTSGTVFGPGDIPFVNYSPVYGTEEMVNRATVTWPAGTATAIGTASIAAYGEMAATYDTLLADGSQAQSLADYQVATYAQPVYRIDSITVILQDLTAAQVAAILAIELGDVTRVHWTPNGVYGEISQYCLVDGIDHSATPSAHTVTFALSQAILGFTLDDAAHGVLDTSALGF